MRFFEMTVVRSAGLLLAGESREGLGMVELPSGTVTFLFTDRRGVDTAVGGASDAMRWLGPSR